MSNLYKDAIADARKLRETAEQNAKNRIIEAVTPKLRRLIERQIAEGDDEIITDDELETGLLDGPDAMDMLDDTDSEEEWEVPEAEPMDLGPDPVDIESDGLASLEVIPDEEEEDEEPQEFEDESQNKSVHVNITVEGKRNYLLRHRAIRLVKALSEAKTRAQRNKIRKELKVLRSALIITENSQNKRLANNLSVILKESNTMRRRKNSWLFEGKDGEAGEEMEFDDMDFEDEEGEEIEEEEGSDTIEVDAAALEDALGLDPGTLSDAGSEDLDMEDDEDEDIDFEEEDEEGEDEDLDLEESYSSMKESDDKAADEDECSEDEVVEVNEAMLRRALGASRRRRTPSRRSSRLSETRRRRVARARRRRRLAEGEAKAMASSFGGGKAGKDMFVEVDENTLLNALAEELGSYGNSTANQGQASKMAGHFGGGSIKKGAVMESRRARRAQRQLAETKKIARKNARVAKAAKAELKESNLFNAKLLFVTKLLQSHSLNNKQQRAIIEAMDNAKTQREAKLLFTSLNESLNKKSLNESKKSKKTLNESRTSYSNRSLQSGQAPRNNAVELDRWAVLAGLKK